MSSSSPSASASPTNGPGAALNSGNQSIKTFAASLSTAAVIFGVQIAAFLIFSGNWKIRRSRKSGEQQAERASFFQRI
jgi:hypothetical protein